MKPIIINSQTRRMLMGGQPARATMMSKSPAKENEAKETTKKVVVAKRKGRIYKKVNYKK